VRFGRRSGSREPDEELTDAAVESSGSVAPAGGPFDISEVDEEDRDCVDLGSLLVTPVGEMELRLQVEEETGAVIAAVLIAEEGALELRAFAASRGGDAWDDLRPLIAAETARMGGTATEQEGPFGTEVLCQVPMEDESGQVVTQASRIMAHEGSAWLLRATLMGLPAVDPEAAVPWEETIRQTVVRRGREAMAPGAALPLSLPPDARRVD
jgi:hypothetical protein